MADEKPMRLTSDPRWRCGLVLLFLAACGRPSAPPGYSSPFVVRVGIAEPVGAPTADAAVAQVVERLQYAALVTMDQDGSIQPGLAEHWQSSPDGLQWRFTLRPNLSFVDGTPLDAAAVAATLDAERQGERPMPGFWNITAVHAVSPSELVIEQRAFSALLLESLSLQWIIGGRGGEATAGPFRLVSRSENRAILEAFDGYYRGRPSVDRVELHGYPSPRAAWVALMRGEIDFLYDVPPEATEFVEADTDVQAFSFLRWYVHLLGFNLRHPALRDARIRQALSLAVDRRAVIAQAFAGRGLEASSSVWPRHWAYDVARGLRRPDPALAESMLAAALGRRGGAAPQVLLSLGCLVPAGYPAFERAALVLQRQLLDVGVELRPEVVSIADLGRRLGSGDFDTYLFEQAAGPGLHNPYWFLHSPGRTIPWVRSGYEAADAALDRLGAARERRDYRAAVRDLQQVLLDDPPAVFLAWRETTRAVRRHVAIPLEQGRDIFPSINAWRRRDPGDHP